MQNFEIGTRYDPDQIEDRIYSFWEDNGFFHQEACEPGDPYTIVIPPPNVTGALHMGHALNNTLQDILIRWHRMLGDNTVWIPGTDHAGIATQNVVEQKLAHDGIHRWDLGREKFIEEVWKWKKEYGDRITKQLRRLGSSLDWSRERFTMDDGLSDAVLETFIRLYDRGLIYKGKYIINWCPRCGTALADDEVEHEEHEGHLWYIQYSFKDDPHEYITVATTRPETMLGDTAVAVNPKDRRYKHLIGRTLILPLVGREIPIIADEWVDSDFGTGAVKITPAHDQNDFEIGNRHNLERISVIDEEGKMTIEAGDRYEGMDRFECREALIEDLREREELEGVEPHIHSVGHCYRCHTVVEPYLSDQWFVKMKPLAERAMQATRDGRVKFHPDRWTDFYMSWLENVRDWCISRQIWWGHRLPVYYCQKCGHPMVERSMPKKCFECGHATLKQDDDVLDTWFSSSLWPFSTLGWPEETEDLKRYYPTSALVTDRGIIYFWVARMVMMGLEMMDEVPFSDVLIHGTILDEVGRKMSKSLGNGIDPIEMIETYGADAVRFSLVMLTTEGQDVKLSESKFEMGRNFANKVWNASRFTLMNLQSGEKAPSLTREQLEEERTLEDRWILSRLQNTIKQTNKYLEDFRTNEAAQTLYDFFWHDFCDWYLESVKLRIDEDGDTTDNAVARETLAHVLDHSLRLLHPFVPFLTETLWQKLKESAADNTPVCAVAMDADAIIVSKWPEVDDDLCDPELEAEWEYVQDIIAACRRIRKEKGLAENIPLRVTISTPDEATAAVVDKHKKFLKNIGLFEKITSGTDVEKPPHSATTVVETTEIFVSLEGLIEVEEEKKRLEEQKADVNDHIAKIEKQLHNPDFLANAPDEVVQRQMDRAEELREKLQKIVQNLAELE
jgi:valyl-tRNA synthetase